MSQTDFKGPNALERLSHQLGDFLAAYLMPLLGLVALALLGGAGWTIWNWQVSRTEQKAQAALYLAEKDYLKKRTEFDRAEMLKNIGKMQKDLLKGMNATEASGDLEKDFGAELKSLTEVFEKHSGTRAAAMAALDASHILQRYKQDARAIEMLQKVVPTLANKELLYGVVLMKLASLQAAQGQYEEAITQYQKIYSSSQHSYFHPEASLRLGVCHEALKHFAEAREYYQRTLDDYQKVPAMDRAQRPSTVESAQKYLLLLPAAGQST